MGPKKTRALLLHRCRWGLGFRLWGLRFWGLGFGGFGVLGGARSARDFVSRIKLQVPCEHAAPVQLDAVSTGLIGLIGFLGFIGFIGFSTV